MRYFAGESADIVWQQAASELVNHPDYTHSGRNGETREIIPCMLRIQDPCRRWILSRRPPYNPAFGLVEFIWIVTGNNESRVPNYWNPRLPNYAGVTDKYHGAYGYRLRHEFGLDQIKRAVDVLTNMPETRQAVLQIWKPELDMPQSDGEPVSKDIPCNVMSLLKVRKGRLHWTQIMRSNDIMRGLPYNIIQFTLLQQVMARWLGCEMGEYFHLSDSLHIYERDVSAFSIMPTSSYNTTQNDLPQDYDSTKTLFAAIYDDLKTVALGNQEEYRLRDIFSRDSHKNSARCDFIKDIMVVIGSDAARRSGLLELASELVDSCRDVDLQCAAMAWLKEMEGPE